MPDQPAIKIATDRELSPETRAMLEGTPEDDVLTDGEAATQPSRACGFPCRAFQFQTYRKSRATSSVARGQSPLANDAGSRIVETLNGERS